MKIQAKAGTIDKKTQRLENYPAVLAHWRETMVSALMVGKREQRQEHMTFKNQMLL